MHVHRAAYVVFLACLAVPHIALAEGPTLTVEVDPRIELLATVQLLSGYDDWTGLITRHDLPYKDEILAHFEPFKDHRAVTMFAGMARTGFAFDAPVSAMLHHGSPPELAPIAPCDSRLAERAGGREKLDAFFEAIRDFAVESSFMEFYDAHEPFYDAIEARAVANVEGIDVALLEDYYGVKQNSYRIIPAPLFHSGGFGPRVLRDDGRYDIHSVCGPRAVEDDVPVFGTPDGFRHLVWHEFSHSFVNPVVDRYGDDVDAHEALMAPIQPAMAKMAYPEWRTCMYEHVVRAVTCRFTARVEGEKAYEQAIAHEKSRDFIYVEDLSERLIAYEADRETYPTFESFFPQLLDALPDAPPATVAAGGPTVVRTVPETGTVGVDPALAELVVEFDRDMRPGGYSWCQRSADSFPETTGKPFWRTPRICVLPVKLRPDHAYWVGFNIGRFKSFTGVDGEKAEEHVLEFTTAAQRSDG